MKVSAIQCVLPNCKDIIYSRSRHDFRSCSCGKTSIDGGFDYTKISYEGKYYPKGVTIRVLATKDELFNDWDKGIDKYGLVRHGKLKKG